MTTQRDAAGFFGKVPSHGDFVTRRLPVAFTEPWDAWLQAGMADSRAKLGDDWLPIYLNSPIWRFALGAGVCGPQAWCGVMMPSVDRVGRYFPFTIACEVDGTGMPAPAWYAALEDLALSALQAGFSLEDCDAALLGLAYTADEPELCGAGQVLFWLCADTCNGQPAGVMGPQAFTTSLFTDLLQF